MITCPQCKSPLHDATGKEVSGVPGVRYRICLDCAYSEAAMPADSERRRTALAQIRLANYVRKSRRYY